MQSSNYDEIYRIVVKNMNLEEIKKMVQVKIIKFKNTNVNLTKNNIICNGILTLIKSENSYIERKDRIFCRRDICYIGGHHDSKFLYNLSYKSNSLMHICEFCLVTINNFCSKIYANIGKLKFNELKKKLLLFRRSKLCDADSFALICKMLIYNI